MTDLKNTVPSIFYQEERVGIFMDGPNLYATLKQARLKLDYTKLLAHVSNQARLVRAFFYTAIVNDETGYSGVKKLSDYLSYNGWIVTEKLSITKTDSNGEEYQHIPGLSIDIAVDMFRNIKNFDHVLLFTGNGEMIGLVKILQEAGVRVTLCGTIDKNCIVSDTLRKQADRFLDIKSETFGGSFKPDFEEEK